MAATTAPSAALSAAAAKAPGIFAPKSPAPRRAFFVFRTRSAPAFATAKTGAKKDPLKTPLSHGLTGFVAIKAGAKSRRFSEHERDAAQTVADETGSLQAACRNKRRQPAAMRPVPSAPVASRKPKGPGLPNYAGRAFAAWPWRFRGFPRHRPKAWFLPRKTRPKPASGRMHCSGSTTKTGAKKDPLKTPPSHGFRDFAAIKAGAKSGRFLGRGRGGYSRAGSTTVGK